MASGPMTVVLRHLHRLVTPHATDHPADRHLLERFLASGDDAAFAALVRRHGAMVLGVGRRLLHDADAAEDVFQATFLVLARRAASIRKQDALGSWLYGVAYRVAVRARAATASRRRRERQAPAPPPADPAAEVTWRELGAVLDEELRQLPDRYRAPLVLCFLEGQTQDEAARELGYSKATLRRRLAHGRELLRRRLLRRGVALSVGLLATALSQVPTPAAVAAAMVEAAVQAALLSRAGPAGPPAVTAEVAALADGVGRAAVPTRLQVAGVVLAVVLFGAAGGWLARQAAAAKPAPPEPAGAPQAAEQPPDPPAERRGPLLQELNHQGFVRVVAFSPDGKVLMSGGDMDRTVRLWDVATGKELVQMRAEKELTGMALSPDGTTVATGEMDGSVRLWQAATGKPLATLKRHTTMVVGLAFAPDGKTLATTGFYDQRVCVWEVATGTCLHELPENLPESFCVAYSPDGKTLAAGGRGAGLTIPFWEVATGKGLRSLSGLQQDVWGLAFSPDGKTLAAACGRENPSLRLWDVAGGKEVRQLETAGAQTPTVAFSPHGKLLASGRMSGELCLWEVITGQQIAQVQAHRSKKYGTYSVSFAPDGRTLATGGEDGFVRLWAVRRLGQGPPHAGKLAAEDLEALWNDLAAADPGRGYRAAWALAAAPGQALPLCRDRLLRPPPASDPRLPQRLARLIADLDANDFEVREKATLELVRLGKAAEPAVRRALENPASLEARRRLERVLAPLQDRDPPGDTLRGLRVIEVLEQVGTPEAEAVLTSVAKDAAEAWLRQEAQAALDRLAPRWVTPPPPSPRSTPGPGTDSPPPAARS
jgi:RNA polymerase sigma factor (sigma-70 family)